MKTVLVLAVFVALALGAVLPNQNDDQYQCDQTVSSFLEYQKKILRLFFNTNQVDINSEYYKIGKDYDIEANIEHYTNKKAVDYFLMLYKTGMLPKYNVFSIFHDELREQAIALFKLFIYAKDFETFYKTASWARIYVNEGMFLYTFYIALRHRPETSPLILPCPYEIYPEMFINKRETYEMHRIKQENGIEFPELASKRGIVKHEEYLVFYANYSDSLTYPNEEQRLSYFTEDVGLNSFYYYFHTALPFWWNSNKSDLIKERRGELYFWFYQQLLARYYLERLSNGLGEIPSFSWYSPISVGYYPFLATWKYPFAQRSNNYLVHTEKNYEDISFLDIYEKTFFQFLTTGHFTAFDKDIDFHDKKAINFVGNYWQTNADLFEKENTDAYQRSYEITARRVLGGAPKPINKYEFVPSALDFYQTSLRDPVFYQLYNKIFDYMVQYKKYLKPYEQDDLRFVGVKINDVKVDKLVTYFDFFDFVTINTIFLGKQDTNPHKYIIQQPRLNHKLFTVTMDIKSDVVANANIKIWIGPKYDSAGFPIPFEKNWMNFVELDWFNYKLVVGDNKIVRRSDEFYFFKDDSIPITEIMKLLDKSNIQSYVREEYELMPYRLMLPKGTEGGIPYQIFVFVYSQNVTSSGFNMRFTRMDQIMGDKSLGYPLDRPVMAQHFKQPNMFFKDVKIYHQGEMHPYKMANPEYKL